MKIKEVSQKFGIPVSTLRYYDSAGLFPELKRDKSGHRLFDTNELENLRIIECLKKSGLTVKEISHFFELCQDENTLEERYELFSSRLENVEEEIKKLEEIKKVLEYKKWFYKNALELGSEDAVRNLSQIPSKYAVVIKELSSN